MVGFPIRPLRTTVDSLRLEHGCKMICVGFASFLEFGWGWGMVVFQVPGFLSVCRGPEKAPQRKHEVPLKDLAAHSG